MNQVVLFAVITLITFFLLHAVNKNEMINVVIALLVGFIATYFIVYHQKEEKKKEVAQDIRRRLFWFNRYRY